VNNGHNWSYLVITRNIVSLLTISGHFRAYLGILVALESNPNESAKNAQKWQERDKYGPNLSYIDTTTNIARLYATLDQI